MRILFFLDNPILQSVSIIPVIFFLLGGISNSSQDSSSRMHQKAPQSSHKISKFSGGASPRSPRNGGPKGPPSALVSINF